MTYISDLVDAADIHVSGMVGGSYNRLTSPITDVTQTIAFEFELGGIVPGSVISIDYEDIFVLEASGSTVTKCVRGYRGSAAFTHNTGDLVGVDQRFSRFTIYKALLNEIASWGPRLYTVEGATISLATDTRGYQLSALGPNFLHVIDALVEPVTSYSTTSKSWPSVAYRIGRQLDTADFTGGNAIFFDDYLYQGTGRRVRLIYAKKFDTELIYTGSTVTGVVNPDTDVESAMGMPASMLDIPPLGAAWRLMVSQEAKRQDTRTLGQSRDATEVPAQAALQTTQALKAMRDARIAEEQLSLVAKYGFNGGF